MNVIAVRASRARGLRVAVTAETAALCMLAVAIAAFVALTWATWGNPGRDTGYDLVAGARVAHGDLPYVDFTYYYGPLAPLGVGLFMWVGGVASMPRSPLACCSRLPRCSLTYALARIVARPAIAADCSADRGVGCLRPDQLQLRDAAYVCGAARDRWPAGLRIRRYPLFGDLGAAVARGRRPRSRRRPALATRSSQRQAWPEPRSGWSRAADRERAARTRLGSSRSHHSARRSWSTRPSRPLRRCTGSSSRISTLGRNSRRAPTQLLRSHAPLTASSFVDLAGKTALYALGAACLVAAGYALERRRGLRLTAAAIGRPLRWARSDAGRGDQARARVRLRLDPGGRSRCCRDPRVRGGSRSNPRPRPGSGASRRRAPRDPRGQGVRLVLRRRAEAPARGLRAAARRALPRRTAFEARRTQPLGAADRDRLARLHRRRDRRSGVKGRARRVGVHPRAGRHPARGDLPTHVCSSRRSMPFAAGRRPATPFLSHRS